jgi:hypothetical protein
MSRRAHVAVVGFFAFCISLSAQQQTHRPGIFSALNHSFFRPSSLTLSDGQRFSLSSGFNWMQPAPPDLLPIVTTTAPSKAAAVAETSGDSSKEMVDVRRPDFSYAGGEIGFLYGASSGKYGGTFEQGYMVGEVGDDKFRIRVGAAYENSNERFPRFRH